MAILTLALLAILFPMAISFSQDMPLDQVLLPGEGWQLMGEGYKFTEGPATDAKGNVYFTDVPESKIYKIDLEGKVTIFDDKAQRSSGLMFGADGRLYSCRGGDKKIVAYDMKGGLQVLAEGVDTNDLVVAVDGGVYYTDPPAQSVGYISPKGQKSVVAKGVRPNGITLWQDMSTLVVTEGDEPHLWTFSIQPDGSLTNRERYYFPLAMPSGAKKPASDGMTVDDQGRLYVATAAGLQVFDPTGRLSGVIAKPQNKFLSNVKFGGEKFDYLYVTCQDKVYRRKTRTTGTPYFLVKSAPAK